MQRNDPPELEAAVAFFEVLKRRTPRIAKPGQWRVFRDGDRVVFEPILTGGAIPANDPEPPMGPLIA